MHDTPSVFLVASFLFLSSSETPSISVVSSNKCKFPAGGGLTKIWPADGLNSAKDSFQKTLLFIKLSKSKSKNPIHLICEGVQIADQSIIYFLRLIPQVGENGAA